MPSRRLVSRRAAALFPFGRTPIQAYLHQRASQPSQPCFAFKYLLARATRRPSAAALSLGVLVARLRGRRNRRHNCRHRSSAFGRDPGIARLSTAA